MVPPHSPAVVVLPQTALAVGVLDGVVGVLQRLVPVETWLPALQEGLILPSPIILTVGGVAL